LLLAVADLDNYIQRAINKIYKGRLEPGQPDPGLVKATADELWKGILQGWKSDPANAKFGSQEQRLLIQLRFNTYITSVFKHHHSSLAMSRELFDAGGKLRSFKEFQNAVKTQVDPKYNQQWLKTEYNTAIASAQQARKWTTYERKGGSITYVAVLDSRTRPDHAGWHGVTLPVDNVWWNYHFPPNGFNCRCTTRWAGTEAKDVSPKTNEDVPAQFKNNVGKTGQAFTDAMPYFTVEGAFADEAARLFGFKPPVNPVKYSNNMRLFETLTTDPHYSQVFTDNLTGGYVFAHSLADQKHLATNLRAAKRLAMNGESVIIREHLEGIKNPEYLINGNLLSDLKTPLTSSGINNRFKSAAAQMLNHLVLDAESLTIDKVVEGINRGFRNNRSIDSLILIYGKRVIELNREQFQRGMIKREILDALK